jgi:hypothetical protein
MRNLVKNCYKVANIVSAFVRSHLGVRGALHLVASSVDVIVNPMGTKQD